MEVVPILYFSLKYHFGRHLDEDDMASVTAGLEHILRDLGEGEADFVTRWNPSVRRRPVMKSTTRSPA